MSTFKMSFDFLAIHFSWKWTTIKKNLDAPGSVLDRHFEGKPQVFFYHIEQNSKTKSMKMYRLTYYTVSNIMIFINYLIFSKCIFNILFLACVLPKYKEYIYALNIYSKWLGFLYLKISLTTEPTRFSFAVNLLMVFSLSGRFKFREGAILPLKFQFVLDPKCQRLCRLYILI